MVSVNYTDQLARVVAVEHHPWPYFTVTVAVSEGFESCAPGQFVMTLGRFGLEPYLRRAFSVFDVRKDAAGDTLVEVFGKVIGPGTLGLATLLPGAEIPLLGPLGQGFSQPTHQKTEGSTVARAALVAGGIGSAALLLWARHLLDAGVPFDFFYGGFGAVDLSLKTRFEELAVRSGGDLVCATENGEIGHQGYITEPLEDRLAKGAKGAYGAVYTCGPEGLMERVAELCRQYSVPGQAALETEMGCGYGACLGCAVAHPDGRYRLCCKDGPVFDVAEVVW